MKPVNRTLEFKGKHYNIYGITGFAIFLTTDTTVLGPFLTEKEAVTAAYSRFNKILEGEIAE